MGAISCHDNPAAMFTVTVGIGSSSGHADLELDKHPNSVTKWLNSNLCPQRYDPGFKDRLDRLDAAISRRS